MPMQSFELTIVTHNPAAMKIEKLSTELLFLMCPAAFWTLWKFIGGTVEGTSPEIDRAINRNRFGEVASIGQINLATQNEVETGIIASCRLIVDLNRNGVFTIDESGGGYIVFEVGAFARSGTRGIGVKGSV